VAEGRLEDLEPVGQPRQPGRRVVYCLSGSVPNSTALYNALKCDHSRASRFLAESGDRINRVVLTRLNQRRRDRLQSTTLDPGTVSAFSVLASDSPVDCLCPVSSWEWISHGDANRTVASRR
jgi:hypothetical protein